MTAEIQDPASGQWLPYPENDNGKGNIRIDGQVYSYYGGQQAYTTKNAANLPPPAPDPGEIPTNDDGSQVGGGTPWDPNSQAPSTAPPGYHWDPTYAMFIEDGNPASPGPAETPAPAGGGGGGGGGGGSSSPPSYTPPPATSGPGTYGPPVAPGPGGLDPWSKVFHPSAEADAAIGDEPLFDAPEWVAPTWDKPADFVAPTGDEVYQDPGYQFRADQGRQRLEASAAAQGLLRSGGTLKDILGYGQSLASQEYGDVYNRRSNEYATNLNTSKTAFEENYGAKRDEFDRLFNAKTAEYAPVLQAWNQKKLDKQNAYDRDWKQYLQEWDQFNTDRNFKLRALGG